LDDLVLGRQMRGAPLGLAAYSAECLAPAGAGLIRRWRRELAGGTARDVRNSGARHQ
jgi:hypothetical protein